MIQPRLQESGEQVNISEEEEVITKINLIMKEDGSVVNGKIK
jgi:hypothetical protein